MMTQHETESEPTENAAETPPPPLVFPARDLHWRMPFRWLALGWQDLRATPGLSAVFGVVIFVGSAAMSVMAYELGRFALLTALLSGFVYLAPLIGVGLYSVSRARLDGRTPKLADSFAIARRVAGHAGVFALIQLVIFMIWSRAGMMVTAFVPVEDGNLQSLIEYLLIGSAIGSLFAALTFAVSAFSLPMIADRDTDMVTACLSSINAVLRNKPAAMVWAALIVALTAVGFATAMVGLGLIMPWLAYATFHGYRDAFAGTSADVMALGADH
ncbi:hypothetical protein C7S18_20865 [Ahniella affigens]|uniref:DUF2189 domain-containing protein n=1 Tax=Ahniella affigens TaxID=2021234 RepID=A0A2P1PX91_9GAMM|nr:DUF2189 domain-containing protein [Ahniella affigens]AVP99471.1 hypothetical protein C7S18_20865 [Ahniella affigens]